MKHLFVIAASLTLTAPIAAQAQTPERLSAVAYLAASQCVAFAELRQLQGDAFNVSALKQAMDNAGVGVDIESQARLNVRDVQRAGTRARDNERSVQTLRERRDDACARFVSTGMVQSAPTNPVS